MNGPSVLFVDDEPHLLSALRRALSGQCQVWSLRFAGSGAEALELLAEQPVDVVVSDMRMPGMDGGQLLADVRMRHPRTARIVLSGHADLEAVVAAVGPTQQFLAKPCDPRVLVQAIETVLATRRMLDDQRLQALLGGIESLPKPPAIYQEMIAVVSQPDSAMADVVAVVERDMATSVEVLKLVNSAFFSLPVQVDSVARAVNLLGLETIQAVALSGAVFRSGDPALPPSLDVDAMREHGVRTGTLAKRIARYEGWPVDSLNHALLAGMLHEVGLLVLAAHQPEGLAVLDGGPSADSAVAELAAFGCTVSQASAYLLGMWGFAEPVVQAIATRRSGSEGVEPTPLAQALDVAAHRSAGEPFTPVTDDSDGYLYGDRLAEWQDVCDEQIALWAAP
jgi:HD-like signal output (HDOD) protein